MKDKHNPDSCTACTACLVQCPVTAVTREFLGPKMVGPNLERMRRLEKDNEPSLEYCSNCKNCDITCPSGVAISTINMLARADYYSSHRHSLRDWILSHGEMMAKLTSSSTAISNFGMGNSLSRLLLNTIGISRHAPLPVYAKQNLRQLFSKVKQRSYATKVVLFPGCFIEYNQPEVGMDFVAVMQANEIEVILPQTVCCGSPLVVNGYLSEAESNANQNMAELKRFTDQGYPIITCCTSCGLMLKQEYQELFAIQGAAEVAAQLYDCSEFLLELYSQGKLNSHFQQITGHYLYHAPCHLRAQGIGLPGLEILKMIPLSIENMDAGCCGISGSYGFKGDKYAVAMAIGQPLFKKIKDSKINAVVSECGTCRLQITHGAGCKTLHPITVMRKIYGC